MQHLWLIYCDKTIILRIRIIIVTLRLQSIHICSCQMVLTWNEVNEISYNCSEGLTCGEGIISLSTPTDQIPLNHLYRVNVAFLDVVFANFSLSEF